MLEKWITFVKGHERLLLALLAAVLLWWGWHQWMAHQEHQLEVTAALRQQELNNAHEASQKASNVVATASNRDAAVDANALKIIASLQAQIAARDKALAARQNSDASLSDQQLANRWATLTGLGPSDLLPNSGGGLSVTHAATVVTVQRLEEVPALEDKLVDLAGQLNQKDGQITAKNDLILSLRDESGKLKVELVKADAACKADTKLAVSQAVAKSKRLNHIWVGLGAILGGIIGWKGHP